MIVPRFRARTYSGSPGTPRCVASCLSRLLSMFQLPRSTPTSIPNPTPLGGARANAGTPG